MANKKPFLSGELVKTVGYLLDKPLILCSENEKGDYIWFHDIPTNIVGLVLNQMPQGEKYSPPYYRVLIDGKVLIVSHNNLTLFKE